MTKTRNYICIGCLREPRVPGALRCRDCESSWRLRRTIIRQEPNQ